MRFRGRGERGGGGGAGRGGGGGGRDRRGGDRTRREEEMVEVEDSEGDELVDIERVEDREEDCRGEDLRTSHQVWLAQPIGSYICLSVGMSIVRPYVCPIMVYCSDMQLYPFL